MTDQTHSARLAEQIVRDHEELCCGVYESETPFCASLAPGTQPLCSGCQKLADAIAAALLREPATDARVAALREVRAKIAADRSGLYGEVSGIRALEIIDAALAVPQSSAAPEDTNG